MHRKLAQPHDDRKAGDMCMGLGQHALHNAASINGEASSQHHCE